MGLERLAGGRDLVVAVVGATGAVGRKLLELLEERRFPVREIRPLASDRAERRRVRFAGVDVAVDRLADVRWDDVDIAFFAAGGGPSREHAPAACAAGALVIDKSSVFRLDPEVPLVIPEINGDDVLEARRGLVANPNCTTSQLLVAVAPLHARAGLARMVVDTYQAVSGAGLAGIEELERGTRAILAGDEPASGTSSPRPVAFDAVPHVDRFTDEGFTGEEMKVIRESRKILHMPDLKVSCTSVRVPVFVGHSEAVNLEFERPLDPDEARSILADAPGVQVLDDPGRGIYPTARQAAGRDDVLVGRIRRDPSCERGLHLWVVGDNLRKGAATNAVQIAEHAVALARRGA